MTGVTPVPPLSVTVPLWVPTAREPVAAVTVTRPFPVPEPGLRVNQAALSLASRSTSPAGVADGERLIGRVGPALGGRKGERGGAGADGGGHGRGADREGDGDGDGGDAGAPAERDRAAVGADGEGARGRGHRDQAISGAGAGAEGQPGRGVTGRPAQRPPAGVADGERLCGRVGPALGGRKGERGGAGADGGGHGRGADREGDGDGDGGDAGAPAERDRAAVGADGEGARGRGHRDQAISGAGAGAEGQPGRVVTGLQVNVPPPVLLMVSV